MIDAQEFGTENKSDIYKDNREEYSTIIDDAFADKLGSDYASNGYDLSTITHQNSNTQLNSVTNKPKQVDSTLTSNTKTYDSLDKEEGANSLVPGADLVRWVALKGEVSLAELSSQDKAQDERIAVLTGEKLWQYGEEAVEMAQKMPETIEYLWDNPEELKKLPGHVQQAIVNYVESFGNNMEAIAEGLVTNELEAIEAQAQAESDLLADLTTTFIGAGLSKVAVTGGKLVVKKTVGLVDDVPTAKSPSGNFFNDSDGFPNLKEIADFEDGKVVRAEQLNAYQAMEADGLVYIDKVTGDPAKTVLDESVSRTAWPAAPAWKEGTEVTYRKITEPEEFYMVIDAEQLEDMKVALKGGDKSKAIGKLGAFATKNKVETEFELRNLLAVRPDWKNAEDGLYRIKITLTDVEVREGTVGKMAVPNGTITDGIPNIDTVLPGGGHQIQFVNSPKVNQLQGIEIDLTDVKDLLK